MVQAVILAGLLLACGLAHAQTQPSCTITAAPATAAGEADVTVTWSATGAVECTASGNWGGTKDCAGSQTFNNVTQDRTFNLTAKAALGRLVYNWTRPLLDTNGQPTTISGYRLFIAPTAAGVPTAPPIVLPADPLTYTAFKAPGVWNGGIMAVDSNSVPSAMSNIVAKTVTAMQGTCSATVTITARPRSPVLSYVPRRT